MPNPWSVTLRRYDFGLYAAPGKDTISLECYVTDADTGTPEYGEQASLVLDYDPTSSATLQGTVYGSDFNYVILLSTNSFGFMQHVLWALTQPEALLFVVNGSPSSTTGTYPYAVDGFWTFPLTPEPAPAPAELALPEVTADTPQDVRDALERLREHKVRLREARSRTIPKHQRSEPGVR